MELGLNGKVAVVIGGSKELARGIALELAQEGAQVAIGSRDAAYLDQTTREVSAAGGSIFAKLVDITDEAQIADFMNTVATDFGGIDVLVNTAGRTNPDSFASLSDDNWNADLDIKLLGMVRCIRAALPYLRRSRAGRIINVNSVLGQRPDPQFATTSAIRAACIALSRNLALDLAAERILVNSVNVGFMEAQHWQKAWLRAGRQITLDQFTEELADRVPLGRLGKAEEAAALVAFLAGERSSYITGASFDVSGGLLSSPQPSPARGEGEIVKMPTKIENTTGTITVKLLHFAVNREMLKANEEQMQLPSGSTAADAWARLIERAPKLAQGTRSQMVAVNSRYANMTQELFDGDELAFIPPVSGG